MARKGYRRHGGGAYRATPARRAALRKAQLISAKKRHDRRKRVATAVGVGVIAVGAGAYLGSKHGHKASGIANQLKAHAPKISKNQDGSITIGRHVANPHQKEVQAIASGVTQGVKKSEKAARKAEKKAKKEGAAVPGDGKIPHSTNIPRPANPSKEVVDAIRKEANRNKAPSILDDSTFNADGTVGVHIDSTLPRNLVRGKGASSKDAAKAVDKNERAKARSGVDAETKAGEAKQVERMIAEGTVTRATRGKRIGAKVDVSGSHPHPGTSRATPSRPVKTQEQKEQELKDKAFEQYMKDFDS